MTQFNLEEAEFRMLNYLVQSQAAEKYCRHKHDTDTDTININIAELSKQAVKEHKDIHKLVVSKLQKQWILNICIYKEDLLCQTKKLKTKAKAE